MSVRVKRAVLDYQGNQVIHGAICSLLQMRLEDYIAARDDLLKKDLIAFDGTLFQVLELPAQAPAARAHTSKLDELLTVEKLASRLFKEV